jgi:hypothetical protein
MPRASCRGLLSQSLRAHCARMRSIEVQVFGDPLVIST